MNKFPKILNINTVPVILDRIGKALGSVATFGDQKKDPKIDVKIMPKSREKYYIDIDQLKHLAIGCSDERCVCKESLEGLESEDGNLEHFIRCYGGPFGLAHTLLLNKPNIQEPNNSGLRNSLTSHKSAVQLVINRLKVAHIVPMLHSDNSSEDGNTFNKSSLKDVGCAFAKKLGVITNYMHREFVVKSAEAYIVSQKGNSSEIVAIMEAKRQIVEQGVDEEFNYGRADYVELVDYVAVLEGSHKNAEDIALVLNYTNNISKPAKGKDAFYDVDVKIVAIKLIELFPEIKFDANTLLSSIELQSITTAHALALGTRREGSDMEMLAIEVFGDRQQALIEIQQLIDEKSA